MLALEREQSANRQLRAEIEGLTQVYLACATAVIDFVFLWGNQLVIKRMYWLQGYKVMAAKLESMRAHLIGNLWQDIETFVDEKITSAFASYRPSLAPPESTLISTASTTPPESKSISTASATPAESTPISTPSATPTEPTQTHIPFITTPEPTPISTPSATPAEPTQTYFPSTTTPEPTPISTASFTLAESTLISTPSTASPEPMPTDTLSGGATSVDKLLQQQEDLHEQWLRRREWQQHQFFSKQQTHECSTNSQELLPTTSLQTEIATTTTEVNAVADTSDQVEEMHAFEIDNTTAKSPAQVGWEQHEREVRRMLRLESSPPCPEEVQSLVTEKINPPVPIEREAVAAHTMSVSGPQMTASFSSGMSGLLVFKYLKP